MVAALLFFGVYVAVLDNIIMRFWSRSPVRRVGGLSMTKKWYVQHVFGIREQVKKNLETRIETMGLENNVFGIEIPTEMVTEITEGGRRVESEKKVFPGYVLVRMELDDRSWAAVRNIRS